MNLVEGDRVDRYVLRARLGEGGQGEVWRAEDPLAPGEPRALKLVRVGSASAVQLERVRREARQLVQLRHPSLVACHALFEDLHQGLLGVVMELADGQALDELVEEPALADDARLLVLAHVAGALAYVHQRGVVHRDIKLENVIVTRAFRSAPTDPRNVKLIDFGIAIESDNPKPLTQLGHVIGTPPYLAPELIEPSAWHGSGTATPTSDLFALGVLAWKLLLHQRDAHPTGLGPRAQLAELAVAYRRHRDAAWPVLSPRRSWLPVVAEWLALEPSARPRDGLAALGQLGRLLSSVSLATADEPAVTPPVTSAFISSPSLSRRLDGALRTEPDAPPTRQSTPEVSVRTLDQPPYVLPSQAPREPRVAARAHGSPAVALAVVLAVGGGGVVAASAVGAALYLRGWGFWRTESAPAVTAAPGPSPEAPRGDLGSASPPSVVSPTLPDPARPKSCAADAGICSAGCCPSGRDCGEYGCGALLQPDESWDLRLWQIKLNDASTSSSNDPSVRVCVTRVRDGASECFSNHGYQRAVSPAALRITLNDLTKSGLAITVTRFEGGFRPVLLGSRGSARYASIKRAALCQGLRFGSFSGSVASVLFYLDDPSSPPAFRECSLAR
ncbi:MAG: serine/threonine-protein kinase [Sorangiineae bacterium]|nr:serine/threonine-protein kinase [Polyangiaceae bacterium]MEB2323209.1 serine/threonine-protein kinase [Sorangiineae bacterium]